MVNMPLTAPVARKVGLIQQSYVGLLIERHLDDFVGLEIELIMEVGHFRSICAS